MWTAAGAEPMSASKMERDLVFVGVFYQVGPGTLPIDLSVEEYFIDTWLVDEADDEHLS